MADKAHEATDERLERMERHLSAVYSRAAKETGKAWKKYLKESGEEIAELQESYEKAKRSGNKAEIRRTGTELAKAKKERTLQDKRFRSLSKRTAEELLHVNEIALAYVNGQLPEVYTINYNAFEDTASGNLRGYSFTLTDADTVRSLATQDSTLLPYKEMDGKKDIRWNTKILNAEVLQGILQGESMDKIASRFVNVVGMNEKAAIRNARTTVTGAENKGRQDSYERAEKDGVILEREWVSTNDGRTRHSHRLLNGQKARVHKPFMSELGGIMFPGDPKADPANVYNCRCTLVSDVIGFKSNLPEEKSGSWLSSFDEIPPKMEFYGNYKDYKNAVNDYVEKHGKEKYLELSEFSDLHDSVWSFGFENRKSRREKAIRFDNTITALQSKYKLPEGNKLVIGDYENAKSFLDAVQRERATGDCAGQAWLNPESKTYVIGYNISYGKTFREDLENRIEKIKSGDYLLSVFENGSPEGIAIHEYGHHVSDYITNGMIYDSENSKAYWDWYRSLSKDDIKYGVSSYATTNRGEFEAECFAELQTDNPRPIAVKYGEFLKKAMEENYGLDD